MQLCYLVLRRCARALVACLHYALIIGVAGVVPFLPRLVGELLGWS